MRILQEASLWNKTNVKNWIWLVPIAICFFNQASYAKLSNYTLTYAIQAYPMLSIIFYVFDQISDIRLSGRKA